MGPTINETHQFHSTRTMFIETLSHQFVSLTGCGVYVFLNPVDVNGLFNRYLSDTLSVDSFARRCVKSVLE